jgi:tRNA-binding protein
MLIFDDFMKLQLVSGKIIKVEDFPEARIPAYKIYADFGELFGIKQTAAQLKDNYTPEMLAGKKIIGCLNIGEKKIARFTSQFLILGFPDDNGKVCLATYELEPGNGKRMF